MLKIFDKIERADKADEKVRFVEHRLEESTSDKKKRRTSSPNSSSPSARRKFVRMKLNNNQPKESFDFRATQAPKNLRCAFSVDCRPIRGC